ncbi:hypothetical protein GEMRC1_000155 [Eukaryota sp. GEM-RC1]
MASFTYKRLSSSSLCEPPLKAPNSPEPAKTYPFELDPFQQSAIDSIEREESVLVSAHTSAGKTVIAEYAIAQALKNKQRVVYTSPIKALSNQKYQEFSQEFQDVGLMTGDVTYSPNAACLVMTTEILRSMLFRGSEVVKEVAWVIFDEVHYLRDAERGVVWEETLILMPSSVRFVFLSATIPNAQEFAEWVNSVHSQPISIVTTDLRPVPLQHYVMPAGVGTLFNVVDEKGRFRDDKFSQALSKISDKASNASQLEARKNTRKPRVNPDLTLLIRHLKDQDNFPVIVFCFSRVECERNARNLIKLDLTSTREKKDIEFIYTAAVNCLSEEDRDIPALRDAIGLLKQGIGIHHSGLFPILKEVTELLFGEGLIKVLFATETFAMGLNMPAKTVVFSDIEKFDGVTQRRITSGEYIQMSGRAGRRGKDDRGFVIVMLNDKVEPGEMRDLMKGKAKNLDSAFRLTFNMILNTLRVEETSAEFLIEKSFLSFQKSKKLPEMEAELVEISKLIEEQTSTLTEFDVDEEEMENLFTLDSLQSELQEKIQQVVLKPINVIPFLNENRLIKIGCAPWFNNPSFDFGWGLLVKYDKIFENSVGGDSADHKIIVHVLVNVDAGQSAGFLPPKSLSSSRPEVVLFDLSHVTALSSLRLNISNVKLSNINSKISAMKNVSEALKYYNGNLPLMHPISDMKINDPDLVDSQSQLEEVEQLKASHSYVVDNQKYSKPYEIFRHREELKSKQTQLELAIATSQKSLLKHELTAMTRVLRSLGFIDDNGVTSKGRVAAEMSGGEELLLSEMILDGTFVKLIPSEIVGILSCFVTEERPKKKEEIKMPENMKKLFEDLTRRARNIGEISKQCRMDVNPDEYVEKFKPTMIPIAMAWSEGCNFKDLMEKTSSFEGNVIKVLRRLDELLRQLTVVAKNICNDELEMKFTAAIKSIKRDIVFSASLYL